MKTRTVGSANSDDYSSALHLIRQIQFDYRRARRDLADVTSQFDKWEASTTRQLGFMMNAITLMGKGRTSTLGAITLQPPVEDSTFFPDSSLCLLPAESLHTLQVYFLGTFRVRVGSSTTLNRWHSTKAKAVLKYLLSHQGRPVSKETLMEALWPGIEPQLANNNLRAAIKALRQILDGTSSTNGDFTWILFKDGNYTINPEADIWTDIEQFDYHWTGGWQYEKAGRIDEAIAEYEAAEALYAGDYLEEDQYEDWTLLERETIRDTYFAILGRLAECHMAEEDYANAIRYCQKIIIRDRCREDAYRRLMTCYSRLGNRNRALEWYRICERTIRQELDLPPERQSRMLYQRLLCDEAL